MEKQRKIVSLTWHSHSQEPVGRHGKQTEGGEENLAWPEVELVVTGQAFGKWFCFR